MSRENIEKIQDVIDWHSYTVEWLQNHWLAHGRYWDNINLPVSKTAITPMYIYELMRECFDEFKRHESDFEW